MNESGSISERLRRDNMKIPNDYSSHSRLQTICEKQILSDLKLNEQQDSKLKLSRIKPSVENQEDFLQFNDSEGKEVKSLDPDSKLSLGWRFSQKSSDRTPSGERVQRFHSRGTSEQMGKSHKVTRSQLILPLNQISLADRIDRAQGNYLSNRSQNDQQIRQDLNYFGFVDYNILENRKIFKERYIGISSQIQPRRARHMLKKEGYDVVLLKNFKLSVEDEIQILDKMLIQTKPRTLSKMERRVLKIMCKRGIPDRYRKQLWLRSSGAAASMSLPENKDYYKNLKRLELKYPNSCFNQIELDLRRTFYELKINQSEQLICKLRNVLTTYCKRNPTIGYCQGMNFLVGRLLKVTQQQVQQQQQYGNSPPHHHRLSSAQTCNQFNNDTLQLPNLLNMNLKSQTSMLSDNNLQFLNQMSLPQQLEELSEDRDEEEAFWIFTHLVESILPIDYYSNMVGALIDQKIFYDFFKETIPDLCQHLEQVGFDPSLLAFQWIVCLLSYNLPQEVSVRIWDLFFLKGTKIIFRMSLALLYLVKNELMNTSDFAEIFEILEAFPRKFIDEKTLIQTAEMRKFKIKNADIKRLRVKKRTKVEADLQKLVQVKENFKGTYTRLKFLNKFYLYNGVQKSDNMNSTTNELFYKTLDQYENEVMRVFNCSSEWPICLFDFTYKNKIPSQIVFKSTNEPPKIIDQYFYPQDQQILKNDYNPFMSNNNDDYIEFTLSLDRLGDGLLFERGQHYCEKFPKFVHNFKRLYERGDMRLFNNQNICFDIVNEIQSNRSLIQFMKEISEADVNLDVYLFNDWLNKSQVSRNSQLPQCEHEKSNIKCQGIQQIDQDQDNQQKEDDTIRDNQFVNDREDNIDGAIQNQRSKKRFQTLVVNSKQNRKENEDNVFNNKDNQAIDDNDDFEHLEFDNDNLQMSVNSLHQSALDLIVGDTDRKKAKKIKNIFNRKLFTKYIL